jgi:transketolase
MTQPTPPSSLDIRDACFDAVYRLAAEDSRVVVLSDDQGALSLERLQRDFPGRFINAGIAEQNLINVAAGMAMGGLRPFVCGITNFVSLRCCEQIAVSVCHPRLPVTILASGGGLTYASDGPTHHATQDIAVIRSMPHVSLFNAADAASTAALVRQCYQSEGPAYLRVEKGCLPEVHDVNHDYTAGYARLSNGGDGILLSTGFAIHTAVEVARQLGLQGMHIRVVDVYRLKPLNREGLLGEMTGCPWAAVLEEQSPVGGLGSLVCEVVAESRQRPAIHRFQLPDAPCYRYGSREWLHRQFAVDAPAIVQALLPCRIEPLERKPAYECQAC